MKCQYCGKECKNKNSLAQHEIRCNNPNKIKSGNNGNYPKHTKLYYTNLIKARDGSILDIMYQFSSSLLAISLETDKLHLNCISPNSIFS